MPAPIAMAVSFKTSRKVEARMPERSPGDPQEGRAAKDSGDHLLALAQGSQLGKLAPDHLAPAGDRVEPQAVA